MKKLNVLLSIFVLLLASNAFAQLDPDTDGIGVYFDMGATETCFYTAVPFEQVTGYLCITNPSDLNGVSGWEATILVSGAAVAPSWTLAAGLDVDATDEGFQVGIGEAPLALEAAPVVVLATWAGFIQIPGDIVEFTISNIPGSVSFDGVPGYGSGSDANVLIPLQVSTGFPYVVCASINACDIVDNDEMSWGSVKTMFQ